MSIVEIASTNVAGPVAGISVLVSLLVGAIWRRRKKTSC
jgi:LPXTG-motif cell wall-anchored protein